jgi:hypothetical protein
MAAGGYTTGKPRRPFGRVARDEELRLGSRAMRVGVLFGVAAVLAGCSADPGDGAPAASASEALGMDSMLLQGLDFPISTESFPAAHQAVVTAPEGSWLTMVESDEVRGVVVPTVEILHSANGVTDKFILSSVIFTSVAVAPNGTVTMKMRYTTLRFSQ